MTIKYFSIEYDGINSGNTFTNGDQINGKIIVETYNETKIQSLIIIAKAKAKVSFTTVDLEAELGDIPVEKSRSVEKYYKVTHVLKEQRRNEIYIIGKGRHAFPFSIVLPDGRIPSSFDAPSGKIVHKLKAKLKQPMKLKKTAEAHFRFVSKPDMDLPGLLEPQHNSILETIKVFGSGYLTLGVHVNKMGFHQGDSVQVTAEIQNNASRSVKPKLVLYERKAFKAQGQSKVTQREIFREKYEAVGTSSAKTLNDTLIIPKELSTSIMNCSFIKLDYFLKVYLDIKYYPDPTINFPIIILPIASGRQQPSAANSGFGSSAAPNEQAQKKTSLQAKQQFVDAPPPYESHSMYPPLGYNKS